MVGVSSRPSVLWRFRLVLGEVADLPRSHPRGRGPGHGRTGTGEWPYEGSLRLRQAAVKSLAAWSAALRRRSAERVTGNPVRHGPAPEFAAAMNSFTHFLVVNRRPPTITDCKRT